MTCRRRRRPPRRRDHGADGAAEDRRPSAGLAVRRSLRNCRLQTRISDVNGRLKSCSLQSEICNVLRDSASRSPRVASAQRYGRLREEAGRAAALSAARIQRRRVHALQDDVSRACGPKPTVWAGPPTIRSPASTSMMRLGELTKIPDQPSTPPAIPTTGSCR